MGIRQLSEDVSVCGQISPADLEAIGQLGFKTIVNNRPDHEVGEQWVHAEIESKAKSAGLAIHYLPLDAGQPPSRALLEEFRRIVAAAEKPVLAYCRSGTRSTQIYMGSCELG